MALSFASSPAAIRPPEDHQISDAEFAAIRGLIYRVAGISLSESKRALVCSRLAKRLRELRLSSHAEYLEYLKHHDPDGAERQEMINCLTTNKTDFFREPHHFAFLREVVFPELKRRAERGEPRKLRIWSAACSMGDEPYSIAMEAMEYPAFARGWDIRILASDISTRVLRTAQSGVYPLERIAPVAEDRRQKYFLRAAGTLAGQCQVRPELKRLIAFRKINLTEKSWPIREDFDVIFCRNVIIYFDQTTQESVLRRLAERLRDGGYLMLGHSECPHWLTEVLTPLGHTIYQKPRDRRTVPTPPPAAKVRRPSPAPHRTTVDDPGPAVNRSCRTSNPQFPRLPRREIVAGAACASREPVEICTLLGSCVAACLYDPVTGIGGMNHFMLPGQDPLPGASARYGVYAMELLINGIMKLGGDRRRLRAKAFGGANVLGFSVSSQKVGDLNVKFILDFLNTEKIPVVAQRLGGDRPVRVHFHSATGRAFVKVICASKSIAREEMLFEKRMVERLTHPAIDNVTLF